MILTIDTINREKVVIGLYENDTLKCFDFETADQSADILPTIEGILKKNNISLKDIKGILVNQGPGSFTGVRVGVTVANALAWSLDIPVLGYMDGKIDQALKKVKKQENFSCGTLPHYPQSKKMIY